MTSREAIQAVAQELTDELAVGTTGYTCRDMQAALERPGNFYMIGSMGLAASLGLGIAMNRPDKRVVVFDGDGSVLMGLGNLPLAGSLRPRNFIHLVFDNEAFASTGNQPTLSGQVPLDALARACGYPVVETVENRQQLLECFRRVRRAAGPVFLLVKCRPDATPPPERIRLTPYEISQRFSLVVKQ